MKMTPEIFTAICAGVTLLIYFTSVVIGAVVAVFRKIDKTKDVILLDVTTKHEQNRMRYDAMQTMLIRHDTWINPEYNGSGKHHAR